MNHRITKMCSKHGNYEHIRERDGYYRCKRCRNSRVTNRRKQLKLRLIAYFGGKCMGKNCGYDKYPEVLEFHHISPEDKEFTISGKNISWRKLLAEAKKCRLLCANCHREEEAEKKKFDK